MRRTRYLPITCATLALALGLAGCNGDDVAEAVLNAAPQASNELSAQNPQAANEPAAAVESDAADALKGEPPGNLVAVADTGDTERASAPRFASVDGMIQDGEYAHEQRIGRTDVYWSNDADYLWMALSARATGYLSVGFDPVNRKVGANYIIGYVKNGTVEIRDNVGTRGNLHDEDINVGGTDDILALAGTEENGVTILEFVIPLDSGDDRDRVLVPGETYEIQTAHQLHRDDFVSMHSYHGISKITLDPVN